jgi:RHS repeat-associated protein
LLKKVTEPSGQATTFGYDKVGRTTSAIDSQGARIFQYDSVGNLDKVTEGAVIIDRDYDPHNRITKLTVSGHTDARLNYDITWSYNDKADSALQSARTFTMTYPKTGGTKKVTYGFDKNGRLRVVKDWAHRYTWYEYDAAGRMRFIRHANRTVREMQFDAASQLLRIQDKDVFGASICMSMFPEYWPNGQVKHQVTLPKTTPFTAPAAAMTYDADNRLLTFNGSSVSVDVDGNMTQGPAVRPNPAGGTWPVTSSYGYDARNRLTSVIVPAQADNDASYTGSWSFGYNADDALITAKKTTGNAATLTDEAFLINPAAQLSQVLARVNADNTMTFYVYGVGLLYEVATDSSGNELTTAHSVRTYHYDQRGCTMAMSSADGHTVTDRFDYSAYGIETLRYTPNGVTPSTTPFRYNGAYGVRNLGPQLLYMRARWYHSGIMRFTNQDPIRFGGGMNWFVYAGGDPVLNLDPSGLVLEVSNSAYLTYSKLFALNDPYMNHIIYILKSSPHTHTITSTTSMDLGLGANMATGGDATNDIFASGGIGVGSNTVFTQHSNGWIKDGFGRIRTSVDTLAHEMFHAYQRDIGMFDPFTRLPGTETIVGNVRYQDGTPMSEANAVQFQNYIRERLNEAYPDLNKSLSPLLFYKDPSRGFIPYADPSDIMGYTPGGPLGFPSGRIGEKRDTIGRVVSPDK